MKNFFIYSAVFMALLLMTVYGADKPILPIPKECPKKDNVNYTVHIAHETNCSKFYVCQGGKKVPKNGLTCGKLNEQGDLLVFNPLLQVCDWPQNVNCKNIPKYLNLRNEEEEKEPEEDQEWENVISRLLMNGV